MKKMKLFALVAIASMAAIALLNSDAFAGGPDKIQLPGDKSDTGSGFGYHCKYYAPEYRCKICNGTWSYCPEL